MSATLPNLSPSAPFTVGIPRLTAIGGPDVSRDSPATFDDDWTLILPLGQRPGSSVPGMPSIGDELTEAVDGEEVGKGFVVTRIRWRQNAPTSNVWVATVTYAPGTSRTDGQGGHIGSDFDFQWGNRSVQTDLTQDAVDGRAVVNSAKEPFENVPQREMLLPCLSFKRISRTHPATYMALHGTVNASSVTVMGVTFARHCARLLIEARRIDEDGSENAGKYEYSIRVEGASNKYAETDSSSVEDIGWDVSVLDCGYCYLDNGGVTRPILIEGTDGAMVRPQAPQLLHNGAHDAGQAYYLRFSPYPEANWSSLHLPTD